nr:hypothetical protein [Tanacetum cinerariifolium]
MLQSVVDQLDWNNRKGDRCPFDLSKPLLLKGRLVYLTVALEYFFNNDLEYLKSSDLEKKYTTSITKTKAARYELVGIEDMISSLWSVTKKILSVVSVKVNKLHGYGHLEEITELYTPSFDPPGVIYEDLNKQKRVMRAVELYKFSDGTLKSVRDELHHKILNFCLGYKKEMSRRKRSAIDKRRSELMVELIDKKMMDNPNITIEEYIRLEEEKAHRHGKVYNWETAKYENDNERVNMPSFSPPKPTVSCFDDLDFFKDFENEFSAIVYNDALTSKSGQLTEPTLSPQHISEFDLKDETSLPESDEVEQNVLYFNDLFHFKIIYPDNLQSDKDNNDNKIDIIPSLGGNVNTQGSNMLLETRYDQISKIFDVESFIMELKGKIMAWNYLVNEMLFNLFKNLYVRFGIPFDPKQYYKDGVYTRMLRRPRLKGKTPFCFQLQSNTAYPLNMDTNKMSKTYNLCTNLDDFIDMVPLPPRDQRHLWLRYQEIFVSHAWRRLFEIREPLVQEFILEFFITFRIGSEMRLDVTDTLCFQLGGARGDLSGYWIDISSNGDFLRSASSYTYFKDPVRRLCHRHAKGRKSDARLSGGYSDGRLAHHFGLVSDDRLRGLSFVTRKLPLIDMGKLVKLNICMEVGDDWAWVAQGAERYQVTAVASLEGRTMPQRLRRLEEEIHGVRQDVRSLRGFMKRLMTDQVIMEYLVKISKKTCILELKRRNMKITDSDNQYAVSIKEDTAYLCLHFIKDLEGNKINMSKEYRLCLKNDKPP